MQRRRTAAVVLPALALALAGCGDDTGDPPDFTGESVALWNPCDALDPAFIRRAFGSTAEEESGTATAPECRFAPEEKTGDAVIEANYQLFPAGLDAAWDTMGQPKDAEVTEPRIAEADDARIVVDVVKKQLYVTGFVQNGDLIQNVNVVDPAPYDEQRVVSGVEQTLTALSHHAAESGVTASPTTSADDPHGG